MAQVVVNPTTYDHNHDHDDPYLLVYKDVDWAWFASNLIFLV